MEEEEAIVELLEEILGERGYITQTRWYFNCPICDEGRDKHNLRLIIFQIYKCWGQYDMMVQR